MDTCRNCGVELPAGARFCPNCGAPVARDAGDEESATTPARRRRVADIAFAALVVLNLLVIGFAVLVFGFGLFL